MENFKLNKNYIDKIEITLKEEFGGMKACIESSEIKELILEREPDLMGSSYIIYQGRYSLDIKLKHITRKRFIKLLMGKYMNKRLAEQFADFIFNRYGYYNESFILFF